MESSPLPRWLITKIENPKKFGVWVSDGKPVEGTERGGSGVSYRLIVQNQGFLDITTIENTQKTFLFDFNGRCCRAAFKNDTFQINLKFPGDGTFSFELMNERTFDHRPTTQNPLSPEINLIQDSPSPRPIPWCAHSGSFKRFPEVSDFDVAYIDDMIAKKYVPYPNIPDEPGKTDQEIRDLGTRLFPWSPHSYQLAMSIYDWTTASFTRMVLMKVFQYTSIAETPLPLDLPFIALMIWESNWGDYKPSNPDFMKSFMMQPANTLTNVGQQLEKVYSELQRFSDVQNRLVAAAVHSLPRTCILVKPYLFSGQVDIYQMGMNRFGIEMLQFPGNDGPVGQALEIEFATAVAEFIKPGSIITTKMVWSFTDTEADAMHYANGILLIVEPPPDSPLVWDVPAYITELSDGPTKTEYIFPPETSFRVLSIDSGSDVQIIRLQLQSTATTSAVMVPPVAFPMLESDKQDALRKALAAAEDAEYAGDEAGTDAALAQSVRLMVPAIDQVPRGEPPKINHVEARKTNGRWCRCVEAARA